MEKYSEIPVDKLREDLADLEHEQWIEWSKNIADSEYIDPERLERWEEYWKPYAELTEEVKDQDREWADKVIEIVEKHVE